MLLGGKFHVKILSSGVEHQKKRSGAPSGTPFKGPLDAPKGLKREKMAKIYVLTIKDLVICLASHMSAAELIRIKVKAEDPC